jgi:hypothetical protein
MKFGRLCSCSRDGVPLGRDNMTVLDAQAQRIEELIDGYLQGLAASENGWSRPFRDPTDGRLWELSYPDSSGHGGGPPKLRQVTPENATKRYRF